MDSNQNNNFNPFGGNNIPANNSVQHNTYPAHWPAVYQDVGATGLYNPTGTAARPASLPIPSPAYSPAAAVGQEPRSSSVPAALGIQAADVYHPSYVQSSFADPNPLVGLNVGEPVPREERGGGDEREVNTAVLIHEEDSNESVDIGPISCPHCRISLEHADLRVHALIHYSDQRTWPNPIQPAGPRDALQIGEIHPPASTASYPVAQGNGASVPFGQPSATITSQQAGHAGEEGRSTSVAQVPLNQRLPETFGGLQPQATNAPQHPRPLIGAFQPYNGQISTPQAQPGPNGHQAMPQAAPVRPVPRRFDPPAMNSAPQPPHTARGPPNVQVHPLPGAGAAHPTQMANHGQILLNSHEGVAPMAAAHLHAAHQQMMGLAVPQPALAHLHAAHQHMMGLSVPRPAFAPLGHHVPTSSLPLDLHVSGCQCSGCLQRQAERNISRKAQEAAAKAANRRRGYAKRSERRAKKAAEASYGVASPELITARREAADAKLRKQQTCPHCKEFFSIYKEFLNHLADKTCRSTARPSSTSPGSRASSDASSEEASVSPDRSSPEDRFYEPRPGPSSAAGRQYGSMPGPSHAEPRPGPSRAEPMPGPSNAEPQPGPSWRQ